MAVNHFYNKDTFMLDEGVVGTEYGTIMKTIAERFAASVPEGIITNTEVKTDTATSYDVYYQLWGKPIYIRLCATNYSPSIYIYELIDGEYKQICSASNSKAWQSAPSTFSIMYAGMGDFYFYFSLINTNGYAMSAGALWGYDSVSETNKYFAMSSTSTSISLDAHYSIAAPWVGNYLYQYDKDYSTSYPSTLTGIVNNITAISVLLGHSYSLILGGSYLYPNNYSSYKKYFKIKWGGKYDLYMLYSGTSEKVVVPGYDYVLDGTTYTAIANRLVVAIENE